MSMLIRPDNGQPAEYVAYLRGHICLRTTCITPAVRWFTHEQMLAANPMATLTELAPIQGCAEPPPIQGCELPPREKLLEVYMPQAMMVAINASSGIRFIGRPAA